MQVLKCNLEYDLELVSQETRKNVLIENSVENQQQYTR